MGGAVGGSGYGGLVSAGLSAVFGGGLATGGPAARGSFHEVNENNPELLDVGGKTYLMMGAQDGHVQPVAGGKSRSVVNNFGVTVQQPTGGDRRSAAQFGAEVARQLQIASARNG
jgi:hypothetical protein